MEVNFSGTVHFYYCTPWVSDFSTFLLLTGQGVLLVPAPQNSSWLEVGGTIEIIWSTPHFTEGESEA